MKKIIVVLLIIFGLFLLYRLLSKPNSQSQTSTDNQELVLFWGVGCPHCQIVDEYISSKQIDQKVKIQRKEVYQNISNQKDLTTTVNSYCPALKSNSGIGIPVLFDTQTKKCYQGDQPIIDFLSQKTGENVK